MPAKISYIAALALLAFSLTGCDDAPDPAMSKEAIATRETPPELMFKGELDGQPTFLLLHDCEVYSVQERDKGAVRWESVLAPDFYPIWTACQRQWLDVKNGELTVTLGRMAFGAGGCCATGGTYRSRDGRNWKKIAE